MDTSGLLQAIDREGQALAAAARAGLDLEVPSCEGWTVHDVIGHVGRVYRSVAEVVSQRLQEQPPRHVPKAPAGGAVVGFFEQAHEAVLDALGGLDPAEPIWTFSTDRTGRFYHRRMAHETAIHRWDAESALGSAGPIDGALAVDGIDEYLDIVLPSAFTNFDRGAPRGSLHLHRTDGEGEWLVTPDGDGYTVVREHRKGDVAVRAPASELLLLLWHRVDPERLETFGDVAVASAWAALAP